MRIADAKQAILDEYTLTLDIIQDLYLNAYYNGEHFLLACIKIGVFSCCLLTADDWETFYEQLSPVLQESTHWQKG